MKNNKELERKVEKAIDYLKKIGCKEIILFGSLCEGRFDKWSDIDLAVRGISPRAYFKAVAVISSIAGHKVDLITMDYISEDFQEKIRKKGKILYAT